MALGWSEAANIPYNTRANSYIQRYNVLTDSSLMFDKYPANSFAVGSRLSQFSGCVSVMHGATDALPANVLGLYRYAYNHGIMCWECDVRPCSDGYVLCHDDDIYNHAVTSDGQTIAQGSVLISNSTVSQLQQYKFGVITGKQADGICKGFETDTIPTLKEFLLLAKAFGATPCVEIKFTPTQTQISDICAIIKSCGMLNDTIITAYQSASTVVSYALANGIKNLYIIVNNGSSSTSDIDTAYGYLNGQEVNTAIYGMTKTNVSEAAVEYATSKGFSTAVYSINEHTAIGDVVNMFENGITYFTTNKDNITEIIRKYYEAN